MARDDSRSKDEEDLSVIRKMSLAGCAFLPWLWILCLIHYRSKWWDSNTSPALLWHLRAQVIGLAISVALFVSWVVIFQQQWRNWGTLGLNMLIYVPDATWWLD